MSSLAKAYHHDRHHAVAEAQDIAKPIVSEELLSTLPLQVQRHFRLCGFVGKPMAMNADIVWAESFIRLKRGQAWKTLNTLQFNSVKPIMRTSLMKLRGVPFEGKDYYREGVGTMKGKVLRVFDVIDAEGPELSQAALITSFAESMLLSGYAFQDYLTWIPGEDHVDAVLNDSGISVRGRFLFDDEGKFKCFESTERFFDLGNGNFEKRKFTAEVIDYREEAGVYQPQTVSVSWWLDEGQFEYFKGSIERIETNVEQ